MEGASKLDIARLCEIQPIRVDLIEGEAYIWDAKDVVAIRKLHLTGALVGTLPRKPWQNSSRSLPLLLLPEEVTILKHLNKLVLTNSKNLLVNASEEQCNKISLHRDKLCQDQISAFVKGRNRKRKHFMCSRTSNPATTKDDSVKRKCLSVGESSTNTDIHKDDSLIPDTRKIDCTSSSSILAVNETTGDALSDDNASEDDKYYFRNATWTYIPHTYTIGSLEKGEILWDFPQSSRDKMRYAVFFDLWKRGYYITEAEKFGADYLVYPSDPLRFHSYFIIHVKSKNDKVRFSDIVAFARLGNSVKKTVVYATVDNDFHIEYNSMCWAGFN